MKEQRAWGMEHGAWGMGHGAGYITRTYQEGECFKDESLTIYVESKGIKIKIKELVPAYSGLDKGGFKK